MQHQTLFEDYKLFRNKTATGFIIKKLSKVINGNPVYEVFDNVVYNQSEVYNALERVQNLNDELRQQYDSNYDIPVDMEAELETLIKSKIGRPRKH